jgi:hypothetical protein
MARLNYLTEIGIAERAGPLSWNVSSDFETALRAFQRAHDAKSCWPSSFPVGPAPAVSRSDAGYHERNRGVRGRTCARRGLGSPARPHPSGLGGTQLWTAGRSWPQGGTSRLAGHVGPCNGARSVSATAAATVKSPLRAYCCRADLQAAASSRIGLPRT